LLLGMTDAGTFGAEPDSPVSFFNGRVVVSVGDITRERVDAIVNAANSSLLGGGGVDGAIHAAGGPEILKACRELRRTRFTDGLPTGEAAITTGGRLPARWVIHTVGPVYGSHGGREPDLLASCYRNALSLALFRKVKTVAFPAISTGIYGYPKEEAARVASMSIAGVLGADSTLDQVRLVFFAASDAAIFVRHQRFGTD
jgi:O-acetyl-ADP-ribose deacetylase (regulator of RNase III)